MKNYFIRLYHRFHISKLSNGFTLVELLIALVISTIIIAIISFALVTITSIDNKAEAQVERQIDLNRAFDFMTHEIKMARRINRTNDTVADGSVSPSNISSLPNIIRNSTSPIFDLSKLGSYGTIVLYLEIPITNNIPAICPASSPNAGLPPPAPTDYDMVVYDIRPTTGNWLSPMAIARYGRTPSADGSIDPCKTPIRSDILVDSITDSDINPTCTSPALKFGADGFYACVNGSLVDLFLRGAVGNAKYQDVTGRAFSRLSSYSTELAPILNGIQSAGSMSLSWTWRGTGSANFKVYRTVDGKVSKPGTGDSEPVDVGSLTFNDSTPISGKQNCYTVTATIGSYTSAPSNAKCANF